jgi:hypothetical protein
MGAVSLRRPPGPWIESIGGLSGPTLRVLKPAAETAVKLLFSRGFHDPSTFNMFYDDHGISQIANPVLGPETDRGYEINIG